MDDLTVTIAGVSFAARLERTLAPRTCAMFEACLPYAEKLIHARWSGEAGWIPMGDRALAIGPENATRHPAPGQVLFYPGWISETEILVPYGPVSFSSRAGPLAGNHFMTLGGDLSRLAAIGAELLQTGAQPIRFERG